LPEESRQKDGFFGAIKLMNNQDEINNYFAFEKKKHFDFFLPFYQEKNWIVHKDNIAGNCPIDWDVKLETFANQFILVDEKARQGDFGDCLVEIIQDMNTKKLGWYFGEKDYILYGSWIDTESNYPSSLYMIDAKKLKEYINNLDGFIKTCISKKGWGNTWNIVLDWGDLINENIVTRLL